LCGRHAAAARERWPVVCGGTRDGDMEEERRQKRTRELAVIGCLPKCRDKSGEIKIETVVLGYERDGLVAYSSACGGSVMFDRW